MEGLNVQHPNQVRKKNKSFPTPYPSTAPETFYLENMKDPSNDSIIANSYIPKNLWPVTTTLLHNLLSNLEQVPVLSAVHGLCSKANFLGCTELNASAPSEAFFPAEGSSCQRLEHDAAISKWEDRGRRKAGGGWESADRVCHFIICCQLSPLVRSGFPATAPITQCFLAGLPHPELPVWKALGY